MIFSGKSTPSLKGVMLLLVAILHFSISMHAQTVTCPPNLNFEQGNFNNWKLFTGTPPSGGCCPISTPTPSTPLWWRFAITSGTGTDTYGGFPIVAPGGGVYSLKLGNVYGGAEAERARYYINVPSGLNNYSIIFRYAVVFEDPNHISSQQPRFEVKAYDSATNVAINCAQFTYISTANLPGFARSTVDTSVWYKSWTTASIDLSGYAGSTIALDFASGDCAQGGHFGYGYVDLNCGLFQISGVTCSTTPTITLSAPPGFWKYYWKDSALTTTIDSGQTVTIATPSVTTTYAVILVPYAGFGCPDTLYTTVSISNLAVNATRDTTICQGSSLQLSAGATGNATPFTYSWTPTTGLSCSTCANPVATPLANTTYIVTVTDSNNCPKKDTITVFIDSLDVSLTAQNTTCAANGSISTSVTPGKPPYTYNWNTSPAQTTATATNLSPGTFKVTVTDSLGCTSVDSATVSQSGTPPSVVANKTNVTCKGGNNGTATAIVSGGTSPYTYSWNTSPVQTTATATNLAAGIYIVTLTDSNGCTGNDTVTITAPDSLTTTVSVVNTTCYNGNNGSVTVTASGGTTPYTYSWNTSPVKTTATATNLTAGTYIVTVTDSNGCSTFDTAIISQPTLLNTTVTGTNVGCFNGSNGIATVSASGGTTPYTYSWNTSPVQTTATATNLPAGTYIVTVTDSNGCTGNDTVTITQPGALQTSVSVVNAACYVGSNGTATVSASGGTTPYTYSWNTSPIQTTATATSLSKGAYIVTVTDSNGCTKQDTADVDDPDSLSISLTTSNAACAGAANGSATAAVSGGTPPYSYSWNTSPAQTTATATGLAAGTYSVTVTDSNGCTKTAAITINAPGTLGTSVVVTAVSCYNGNNGSATVTASGGTLPYTYNWNTSPVKTTATATNLAAGTYIVTVTDSNGCSRLDTAIISQPTLLNTNVTGTSVGCFNGSNGTATVSASGGTAPYTYSWNTSPIQTTATATNLAAGTYIVTVTDSNGCTGNDTITITQPGALQTSVSVVHAACYGGSNGTATVLASGGTTPYTYSWNTSPIQTTATATSLSKGAYIVTVTDSNGCTKHDTADVDDPDSLSIAVTGSNTACAGAANGSATAAVSGGTPPYSYSWNTSPTQTTATATGLGAGTYTVTVTDSNGCTQTATITINAPGTLGTSIVVTAVSCYNGDNGTATVTASGGTTPYTYSWNTSPVQTTATATNLAAGTYIVTVTDSNGCNRLDTAIISQPTLLNTTVTATTVSCFNGSNGTATVFASGGIAPYTYSWNTSPVQITATATNLAAGTYIVTVTDSNGCSRLDTTVISQPTLLNTTVSGTGVSCYNGSNGTATVLASGGKSPYTYSWNTSPVQTTATAINLPAGTYFVIVTDSNGCVRNDTTTISQPSPMASVITVTGTSCYNASNGAAMVAVSGGVPPYSYSWNTNPVQATANISNLTAGIYIVTITDSNGCTRTDTAYITHPDSLDASAIVTNVSCYAGSNGTATVTTSGGTQPYTYSWNITPVQTSATATNLAAGTYVVTVTDSNGCTAKDTVTVSQPLQLAAGTSATGISCYNGSNGTATVIVSGGKSPYTYSWNTTPAQTTPTAINLTAGTYIVSITDSNGCTLNDTVVVTHPPLLNVAAATTRVSCNGGNDGTAFASVSGGTPGYTFNWSTSPVQTSAVATGLSAGTYIITITDSNGCTGADTVNITEPSLLLSAITTLDAKCFGDSNGRATVSATGGTPAYSYTWSTMPVQTTATASGLPSGAYIVTIKDSNGCMKKDTAIVNQPAALKLTLTKENIRCHGDSNGSATVSVAGGIKPYSYLWNSVPPQATITANGLPAGVYSVMVTDSNGCMGNATDTILQPPLLNAIASGVSMSCTNASTGIAAVRVSGGTPSYSIRWNTSPVQTGDTAKNLHRGEYVSYATDANGCVDSDKVVINSFTEMNLDAGPDSIICPGDSIKLSAKGAVFYSWLPNLGLSCTTCAGPKASPTNTMVYTVIGVDSNNCHDTDFTTISVVQKEPVSAGPDINICDGESAQLSASGGESYTWDPDRNLDNNKIANPVVATDSSINYRVIIRAAKCFVDTLYQSVFVHTRPTVELGPDMEGIPGASFQLHAETTNTTSILWEPPIGLSCNSCYDPVATVHKTTTYKAIVSNNDMCFAEDNVTIKVACDDALVFIPNTFTPNGDGVNDYFYISAKGLNTINLVRIYNRWGERLFEARDIPPNDQHVGWDGTYKTERLSPDVFVYYIEIQCSDGRLMLLKGDISLVR